MKNGLYFILILVIGFTSCEGRKSQRKALTESISSFKKDNTIKINEFIPETYFEHRIDTILSNGFRVKIQTSTDMINQVVFTKTKDNIDYVNNYRNFNFNVTIEKNGKKLFDESFNKQKVNDLFGYSSDIDSEEPIHDFNTLALLKSIHLNEELSVKNDSIYIDIAYAIPNEDYIDWHTLKIDKHGKSNFIQLTY
ncbi:hypothetical protein [Winogradskyella haliclonae]|uniref:Uncharacterized protein n=1 Tax=Winogradskyella haliclonae TaxID=2048558 RepID=A0ABQ2C2E6_9FLAO|nr:hypothetical protein [Winogradskyella haliclonae]GGI57293.1 hypothetical protein GCM10011444_16020 [Winogradskyella haliclonae]